MWLRVNNSVKNVHPAAHLLSFPATWEALVKSTSPSHSYVRAGLLGSSGFRDSSIAKSSEIPFKSCLSIVLSCVACVTPLELLQEGHRRAYIGTVLCST